MPFRDVLGQPEAVDRLRRAWIGGRLAQAYCFTGPTGVGKRTTALALAQALNCLAPTARGAGAGADACGSCRACRRIAAGVHPDVTLLTPQEKTVITIEQIRDLSARAGMRPYEGAAKVWILDPADRMQEPAANAFLKTLEEPAGVSLFILVTASPSALLPTIQSRCQALRFEPLGEASLRRILEDAGRSPQEAASAAAMAGGSAEQALEMDVEQARALRDRLVDGVWGCLGSLPALLEEAARLAKEKAGLEQALQILAGFTRDLALVKLRAPVPLAHAERQAEAERIAAAHSLEALLAIHAAQVDAQQALVRYAHPRLTAERMLLRMRTAVGEG